MQKQAPSIGTDPGRRRLHALVLRPDPLPLDRLRRPDPAEAGELPHHRLLPGGDLARAGVRRADRRRLGRQGEDARARPADVARQRPATRPRRRSRSSPSSRRSRRTRGRSCARRRCSARPTSSSPRARSRASSEAPVSLGAAANVSDAEAESVETIAEGGTLGVGRTEEATQIDEIFNALDEETRTSFQRWQANAAVGDPGRGLDLNDALGNLGPFVTDAADVLDILNRQKVALQGPRPRHGRGLRGARPPATRRSRARSRLATTPSRRSPPRSRRSPRPSRSCRRSSARPGHARAPRRVPGQRPAADPELIPVARDLSPTLASVRELSPNLRSLFFDLDSSAASARGACRRSATRPRRARGRCSTGSTRSSPTSTRSSRYLDYNRGTSPTSSRHPAFAHAGALGRAARRPAPRHALRSSAYLSAEALSIYPGGWPPTAATATCRPAPSAGSRPRTGSSRTSTARTPTTRRSSQPARRGRGPPATTPRLPAPRRRLELRSLLHPGRVPAPPGETSAAVAFPQRLPRPVGPATPAALGPR